MKYFITVIFLFFTISINSQEKKIKKTFKRTSIEERIDYSNIYNKQTGKKISKKEFIKLIKSNPNLPIQKIIGKDGNVIKYLVDTTPQKNSINNFRNNPIKNGEIFPNFIVNTTTNKKIELNTLKGKIVIVRFELEANSFRFKKDEISMLDAKINQINNKEEKVVAIIIFASSKSDINKGFNLPNSNFNLVANGNNFFIKYSIRSIPSTAIIDQKGKLIQFFDDVDTINLKKILSDK